MNDGFCSPSGIAPCRNISARTLAFIPSVKASERDK
jgi:hypothetical protein